MSSLDWRSCFFFFFYRQAFNNESAHLLIGLSQITRLNRLFTQTRLKAILLPAGFHHLCWSDGWGERAAPQVWYNRGCKWWNSGIKGGRWLFSTQYNSCHVTLSLHFYKLRKATVFFQFDDKALVTLSNQLWLVSWSWEQYVGCR